MAENMTVRVDVRMSKVTHDLLSVISDVTMLPKSTLCLLGLFQVMPQISHFLLDGELRTKRDHLLKIIEDEFHRKISEVKKAL